MKLAVHHTEPTDRTEPYGLLVCVCPEPDADLARNFGECSSCRRKPLALMGAKP